MNKTWRPDDWYEALLEEVKKIPDPKGDMTKALLLFSEAGADAILEALKTRGHRILPQDNDILSNLYPNQMGWVVFIPEEQ